MKKVIGILLFVLFSNALVAQDIITKKDGEDIQAKVLEVLTSEIKYKKFDFQDGPTYTELKSNILMIRYENGLKDIFDNPEVTSPMNTRIDNYGVEDARTNYRGANSGAGWVFATAILTTPVVALIPALICSNNAPNDLNLNYPNPVLMENKEYANQYKKEAYKIKRKKIWTKFGTGTVAWCIIWATLINY